MLDVPADLPPAFGDEARLVQVLNNLAGNAFKHSPAGTPVELRARADGDRVSIAVIDSGPGIEPEFLAHIFEPFSQASGSGGRDDGLGLGLYIVQALAEAMGGAVRAESSPGTGSRFTVTLRRA